MTKKLHWRIAYEREIHNLSKSAHETEIIESTLT
jgi:hypothetical protein